MLEKQREYTGMLSKNLIVEETSDKAPPKMAVLQPQGLLSDRAFQTSLEQAIAQGDTIVIDLLWTPHVDPTGIAILLAGVQQAKAVGKLISFLSMDAQTRAALDAGWENQRRQNMADQTDWFAPAFEQFLDSYRSIPHLRSGICHGHASASPTGGLSRATHPTPSRELGRI